MFVFKKTFNIPFALIIAFKKMIALLNKPGGGGINPFVTVVLHGGGGVQMWPKSCYVICEWPHSQRKIGKKKKKRFD